MGRYRKETYILQFTSKLNAEKMYTEYMLWRLDVICKKGTTFSLVKYDAKFPSSPKPYIYKDFNSMYVSALNILHENGFSVSHVHDFGSDWYDIWFINRNDPNLELRRFSITPEMF